MIDTGLIRLELRIENRYESGALILTTADVEVPRPPEDEDERDDWEYDYIFCETGTGRTDGDAWYDVEVTASSDPDIVPVGTKYEFGY